MKQILTIPYSCQSTAVPADFNGSIKQWLEEQANTYSLRWLLAHADDGVIWGEVRESSLHLSGCLFEPDLRATTLQMARLFGEAGELYLWKNDNVWSARLVLEGKGDTAECYDEGYLLWGTHVEKNENGFVHLRHGSEGLRHAPPFHTDKEKIILALNVRHFIEYDKEGQAYVEFSRLMSINEERRA